MDSNSPGSSVMRLIIQGCEADDLTAQHGLDSARSQAGHEDM